MDLTRCRTDLPILLLYNLDPEWSPETIDSSLLLSHNLIDGLSSLGHPAELICVRDDDIETLLGGYDPAEYIVFNWCEEFPGKPNSYAEVAQKLEAMGFIFTGADSHALEISADKRRVKKRLDRHHIPTPIWDIYETTHSNGWKHYPAIVKPALEHCSYGITPEALVWSRDKLLQRVEYVLDEFKQPALVEEFIDGREFHVTVIGNGELKALPAAEMDFSAFSQPENRLCTYDAKFDPTSNAYNLIELKLPAQLSVEQQKALEVVSISAYRVTECRDYARMDIRLRGDTFYVLDVNPNADFSPDTSTVLAAEIVGIPYPQLGSLLVNLAAQRHAGFAQKESLAG
jgi:D-alanine-D-alanine ligase